MFPTGLNVVLRPTGVGSNYVFDGENPVYPSTRATAFVIVWREQSEGIDPWRPKEQWHPYDPMFISEGMYGAANIFRQV